MITIVIDVETNLPIPASEAHKHKEKKYACPGCGCPVTMAMSSLKNAFGRCSCGKHHKPGCIMKKHESDRVFIDPTKTTIAEIDKYIMTKGSARGGGGGTHPGNPHGENEKVLGIRSLKDINKLCLNKAKNFRLSDITLDQILINSKTIRVYNDLANKDLGMRAVTCVPILFSPDKHVIRFSVFYVKGVASNNKKYCACYFDLNFSEKDYLKTVSKLWSRDENGKRICKFDHVLIYGRWEKDVDTFKNLSSNNSGEKSWPCKGYQRASCVNVNRQILVVPAVTE